MAQKFSKAELSKKTAGELHTLGEDEGVALDDKPNKATLIERLLEVEAANDEDELDDEELDDEELDDIADAAEVDSTTTDTKRKVAAAQIKAAAERGEENDEVAATAKKSRGKAKEATGDTMAAKQVANELGIEAKTLRQFFRSPASTVEPVGSGGRYEFEKSDLPKIKKEFETWRSQHAARGTKRSGKDTPPKNTQEVIEIEDAEELDIDELDDEVADEDLELDD
jgi:hypothetical protein